MRIFLASELSCLQLSGPRSNSDGATYYNDISDTLTGSSLTSALRTLNNSKKKRNGGYNALLKDDFWARYTDFDSNSSYSQDTTHDLPYSNKIVSFYSGNVATNKLNII